jgi:hypothetical protein
MPSLKAVSFASGTFVVGTAGVGGILMRPSPCNNESAVKYTLADYADSDMHKTGTGIGAGYSNSPYAVADLGFNDVEYRPVHAAIRYRYVGTELNRGGISASVVSPHHHDMSGSDLTKVKLYDKGKSFPVTRTWKTVEWLPVRSTELEYSNANQPDVWPCVVVIEAEPGVKFEWEYVSRHEYIGRHVRTKTPSEASPVLFERLLAYTQNLNQEQIARMVNSGATAYRILRAAGATPGTMYRPLTN